jgi:hypothetical protein
MVFAYISLCSLRTLPVEDAATRRPACPVASENGTGVGPEDRTGVKSDPAFI